MKQLDRGLQKVLMSNRQFAALKMFVDEAGRPIASDVAINIDQRSLGSLYHRGYISFGAGGFRITPTGKRAMELFEGTVVMKDHPSRAFSHYIRTIRVLADYTSTMRRAS